MSIIVSAIMPTRNRRQFVPAAIACFLSQDWQEKELIIVDDGEPVSDLAAVSPLVRYVRMEGHNTIGAKRNAACAIARGEYIVHWDDDDWSAPKRISEQVRILRQSSRPATGYNVLPFAWDEGRRAWLYLGANGYACGTSLCYLRATWAGHRFPAVHIGEDNAFLEKMGDRFLSVSGSSIVARIHGAATCPKIAMLSGQRWTGAPGENWQEIDYGQLAACGYPIVPAVACARAQEPADDGSGDRAGDHGAEIALVGSTGRGNRRAPHRARARARG